MLVGETLSGKSSCMRVLIDTLNRLHSQGKTEYCNIEVTKCNPKAVNMDQLYGQFDPVSHDWTDGILPCLVRKNALIEDPVKQQWVVFDGPVDALWIENMNTVLDDNKKLCLSSGEIITLGAGNRMIFEVRGKKRR